MQQFQKRRKADPTFDPYESLSEMSDFSCTPDLERNSEDESIVTVNSEYEDESIVTLNSEDEDESIVTVCTEDEVDMDEVAVASYRSDGGGNDNDNDNGDGAEVLFIAAKDDDDEDYDYLSYIRNFESELQKLTVAKLKIMMHEKALSFIGSCKAKRLELIDHLLENEKIEMQGKQGDRSADTGTDTGTHAKRILISSTDSSRTIVLQCHDCVLIREERHINELEKLALITAFLMNNRNADDTGTPFSKQIKAKKLLVGQYASNCGVRRSTFEGWLEMYKNSQDAINETKQEETCTNEHHQQQRQLQQSGLLYHLDDAKMDETFAGLTGPGPAPTFAHCVMNKGEGKSDGDGDGGGEGEGDTGMGIEIFCMMTTGVGVRVGEGVDEEKEDGLVSARPPKAHPKAHIARSRFEGKRKTEIFPIKNSKKRKPTALQ